MDVDQAGHHVAVGATDFEDAGGIRRGNVGLNGGDSATGNSNIHAPVEPLARVKHMTTLDQQVIRHMQVAPRLEYAADPTPCGCEFRALRVGKSYFERFS